MRPGARNRDLPDKTPVCDEKTRIANIPNQTQFIHIRTLHHTATHLLLLLHKFLETQHNYEVQHCCGCVGGGLLRVSIRAPRSHEQGRSTNRPAPNEHHRVRCGEVQRESLGHRGKERRLLDVRPSPAVVRDQLRPLQAGETYRSGR